jgi:hypothetical protein
MPRARRLLPEARRVGAHVVGPRRRLVERFARSENLADVRSGEAGKLRVGDCGDDPVAGLAPGERGRGKDEGRQEGGGKQAKLHSAVTPRFG